MKNLQFLLLFLAFLFGSLIILVYTWDIPAPTKLITKDVDVNDEIAK